MDPINNPFSPGAGTPPHELVGREDVLEQSRILLGRVQKHRPEKSIILTGLRGVGKTVLLNEMQDQAESIGYRTVLIEAHEDKSLAVLLSPQLRQMLFRMNRMAGAGAKCRRALSVLKGFVGSIKIGMGDFELGLDINSELGTADSGDIEIDLPDLLVAVAEAAVDKGICIAVLIDEIQYFNHKELSALVMSMHKMQQKQLPLVLIGAGLPILPGLVGESKSYAERLFSFIDIGAFSEVDSRKVLQEPVRAKGIDFDDDALKEIYKITQGYPYFLQEWGYQVWNIADTSPIDLSIIKDTTLTVLERLDVNFFRVRFSRLTSAEKVFLRAMSELGSGPHKTSDVANALHLAISKIGPVRANLINKGMIYSPIHGKIAFTVPLFDKFMKRAMQ
jgi:hypothetical protein